MMKNISSMLNCGGSHYIALLSTGCCTTAVGLEWRHYRGVTGLVSRHALTPSTSFSSSTTSSSSSFSSDLVTKMLYWSGLKK